MLQPQRAGEQIVSSDNICASVVQPEDVLLTNRVAFRNEPSVQRIL